MKKRQVVLLAGILLMINSLRAQCFWEVRNDYIPEGFVSAKQDSTVKFTGKTFDHEMPEQSEYISKIIHNKDTIFVYSKLDSVEVDFIYCVFMGYKGKPIDSSFCFRNNLHQLGSGGDFLRLTINRINVAENDKYKLIYIDCYYKSKPKTSSYCELFLINKTDKSIEYISYLDHSFLSFYLDNKGNIMALRNQITIFGTDSMNYEYTIELRRNKSKEFKKVIYNNDPVFRIDALKKVTGGKSICRNIKTHGTPGKIKKQIKKALKK